MAVIIKGRNTVVSPAVKAYVEKKIDKVTRQFKAVGDITAVLKVENGNHIAEITVPAKGILLRAQESTKDMYSSIDLVVEKIERQVHKYKTKLMKRKYSNFRDISAEAVPAAEPSPAPARSRWHTTAFSFWTSCRNFKRTRWRCCVSPLRTVR